MLQIILPLSTSSSSQMDDTVDKRPFLVVHLSSHRCWEECQLQTVPVLNRIWKCLLLVKTCILAVLFVNIVFATAKFTIPLGRFCCHVIS